MWRAVWGLPRPVKPPQRAQGAGGAVESHHAGTVEEPAEPRSGGVEPLAPAFDGRVVVRFGDWIGGDFVIGNGLGLRHRRQVGKRRVSARSCATARKQERGQED
jgi:hypothetical protein